MRKRVPIGAVLTTALAVSLPAIGWAASRDSHPKPPPDARTVPSLGPGADYKSDPAAPEQPDQPRPPWTLADAQKVMDPTNDPNIRICDQGGGHFLVQYVRVAPAGAPLRPLPAGARLERIELIRDGGPC
jgi:hypothetical protein